MSTNLFELSDLLVLCVLLGVVGDGLHSRCITEKEMIINLIPKLIPIILTMSLFVIDLHKRGESLVQVAVRRGDVEEHEGFGVAPE